MRVVTSVKFRDRLGINVSSFRFDQDAFLKVSLKYPLQRDKKSGAIMAVPVRISARRDFCVVDENLHFGIPRDRCHELVKQNVPIKFLTGLGVTAEAQFEFVQSLVDCHMSPFGSILRV